MRIFLTKNRTLLKSVGIWLLAATFYCTQAQAQCGFATGLGCPGTDYSNFGYNSTNVAATLEYDNFVSTFHSTIVRDSEGKLQIWGQNTGITGTTLVNLTAKTEINATNFSGLTGTTMKAAMGSTSITGNQIILLTTTGLFVWGSAGTVLSNNAILSNQSTVKKIAANSANNINQYGLPGSVTPTDVKMMFATYQTFAIVTCSGEAWVLSQNVSMRGAGTGATSATTWYQVKTNATGNPNLTGVVAVRGNSTTLVALTNTNEIYTWGAQTLLGNENNSNVTIRNNATAMTLPEAGNVKMIGITNRTGGTNTTASYYVLFTNGHLWAMGNNSVRQLGDWTTDASPSATTRRWVQPKYPNTAGTAAGEPMNDIKWISPNEHDNQNAAINVINNAGRLWNFGTNAGTMLGRLPQVTSTTSNTEPLNPGQPLASTSPTTPYNNFDPLNSVVLGVETGGHTSLIANRCEQNFGYVGHATNGSAGNAVNTNYFTYTFSTAQVNICGAEGSAGINFGITPTLGVNGLVCATQSVTLTGSPVGGTFAVVSGPATLVDTTLSFTATTGTVIISYTVSGICGPVTVQKSIAIEMCTVYNITGTVWIDNNANAIMNTGENGSNATTTNNGGLWANLVNSAGQVVASVRVAANGTYTLPTTANGTYSVTITNSQMGIGTSIPTASTVLPAGWVYTGNNNASNTPCVVPSCTNPSNIPGIVINNANSNGNDFGIKGGYTVSGNVYHDGNGLNGSTPAVDGTPIHNPSSTQLYISVLDSDGKVIHYVPVASDGSYTIDIPLKDNAILQLTTTVPVIGTVSAPPTLPAGWANAGESFGTGNGSGSGINDGTGTGSNGSGTQYNGQIHISFPGSGTTITGVNFGIQQPPVADPKEYLVGNSDFTTGAPSGFPALSGYQSIPMASPALIEATNSSNGSLSGSDPEDCNAGNCNGNTTGVSSTFTIVTINSNTLLYYDFGGTTGVQQITPNTTIPNFDITKMVIYGQNGQGNIGNELGFTYSITDKAGASSAPAPYVIATLTALPVRLLYFSAHAENSTSKLLWATATEQNNKGFEIERSIDGINWKSIGFVESKAVRGNSGDRLDYSFTDNKPVNGKNFYRLVQTDYDGKLTYSFTRIVMFGSPTQINAYPNPTKDIVYVTGLKGNETIKVYDATGRLVIKQTVNKTTVEISFGKFSEGIYHLHIEGADGSVTTQKAVKIK